MVATLYKDASFWLRNRASRNTAERSWIPQEKVLGECQYVNVSCRKCLIAKLGAGKGNRTLIASLEGWSFTIKLCPRLREKT